MRAGGFEKIQRAVGVDGEIRLRIARGPIVRRLRGRVDDGGDLVPLLLE